ncbi:pantoate--beta-alanine ligase [Brevirhabdus sp.]|uniref:pantoate--beta-alanine ligase n=1 Tax=Brevirhabdus sp. TaxID=2004514 RepID=UPI004058F0A2
MQICETKQAIRAEGARYRAAGDTVALVPTMGALHAGHMSLIAAAREHASRVVVSIFVNPSQFEDPADLEKYPRDTEADLAMLRAADVNAVFLPSVEEIYPEGDETIVETTQMANMLHGLLRPGHYRGVATVVCKLFNIVGPDVAVFGEKDYQQLQVIRQMVRDLHMPLRIVAAPTVREDDGLALSSRNRRLTPEDRAAATVLSRALNAAQARAAEEDGVLVEELHHLIADTIREEPRARLEAVDMVAVGSLEPASGPLTGPVAFLVSADFDGILLIDQTIIHPHPKAGART